MKMKKQSTQDPNAVIGIDLGDKKHAVCVLGKRGDADKEFDIPNRKDSLLKLAEGYPGARVAIEVGTHSPWISRLLTDAGMSVTVANARRVRAIYDNDRKCDRRDAAMLAKLLRVDPDLLHPVHHRSETAQRHLMQIKLRDTLVRQRANIVLSVRGLLKSIGERVPPVSTAAFAKRVRGHLPEEPELLASIAPALESIDTLTAQIRTYDQAIADVAQNDYPQALHLQQITGVGPVTSLCFVLSVENPSRFPKPRDVGPWLGLVPKRDQSGESDRELPVSKAGNRYLRSLLVQCAHYLLGPHGPDCDLRQHGLKLAARGGRAAKKKAIVAISRKLAVLMLAMWKDQSAYVPLKNSPPMAA
jgi:transposase